MTTCSALSDRMPDVAHGRSLWTASEERHLATCADCGAEWALIMAAARLGTSIEPSGDPNRLAALLLERLARERELSRRLRLWTAAGLAAAAAIVFAVWTGAGSRIMAGDGAGGVAPTVATAPVAPSRTGGAIDLPLPELDDLPAEALDSVLEVLDEPAARADAYELPGFGDSGDRELEQALTGLEG